MISSKNAGKINFITYGSSPTGYEDKEKSIPTPLAPKIPNIPSNK